MRRRLRPRFVKTGGANERPWNCLNGSRDPLAILVGIPSCSHLRAHLAFSDSKGLFDQRTRNGDSRSSAGLDRNRSSANWSCRWLITAGRCAGRRWRRCSDWCPWVPLQCWLWIRSTPSTSGSSHNVTCPRGRTTNSKTLCRRRRAQFGIGKGLPPGTSPQRRALMA